MTQDQLIAYAADLLYGLLLLSLLVGMLGGLGIGWFLRGAHERELARRVKP